MTLGELVAEENRRFRTFGYGYEITSVSHPSIYDLLR
jgi:hypothetical protein